MSTSFIQSSPTTTLATPSDIEQAKSEIMSDVVTTISVTLSGHSYDFDYNANIVKAVIDLVTALGGTVSNDPTNFPEITSFSQDVERLQTGEITFDAAPIVMQGENLANVQTVEIWRYPNGYDQEHDYELTQLKQISSTATTITAVNETNTSGHVDGLWWGKPVRIIAKWADGNEAYIDATFHDDND